MSRVLKQIKAIVSMDARAGEASGEEAAILIEIARGLSTAAAASQVAVDLKYNDLRQAYENAFDVCEACFKHRNRHDFGQRQRNSAASRIGEQISSHPILSQYVRLLQANDPWEEALNEVQHLLSPLKLRAIDEATRTESVVQANEAIAGHQLAHVRVGGVGGAMKWLSEEAGRSEGRSNASAFQSQHRELRDVRRSATFLPKAALDGWKKRAQEETRRLNERIACYRSLLSDIEVARRCERLEAGYIELDSWLQGAREDQPRRKPSRSGALRNVRDALREAESEAQLVPSVEFHLNALYDWAALVFTNLRAGIAALISVLGITLAAGTVSKAGASGTNGDWASLIQTLNHRGLFAFLTIVAVVFSFFVAQLISVRRRGRTLGVPAFVGALVCAIALPFAVVGGIDIAHGASSSDTARREWLETVGRLEHQGYVCREGYREAKHDPAVIVLTCNGSACKDEELGSTLAVPMQRLSALESHALGSCFKLEDGAGPRTQVAKHEVAFPNLIADLGRLSAPRIVVDADAMRIASDSVQKLVDALEAGSGRDDVLTLKVDEKIGRALGSIADESLGAARDQRVASQAIGGQLWQSQRLSAIEMKLVNCWRSRDYRAGWWDRRKAQWRGRVDDPCYTIYLTEMKEIGAVPASDTGSPMTAMD